MPDVLHGAPMRGPMLPAYPTRLAVLADPRLLRRLPVGWLSRRELRAAAGLLLGLGTLGTSTGCIFGAVAAYEPLTESQALSVIREEMASQGVCLAKEHVRLSGVKVANQSGAGEDFTVDLTDASERIAVEYVSGGDFVRERSPDDADYSKFVARLESTVRAQAPGVYFGAISAGPACSRPTDEIVEAARGRLREQVRSFIDWLKAQGVI